MKNFQVTSVEDGKKYWISRSCAVAVFLFVKDRNDIYILANKRGNGAADFQGLWNCPCGYIDFDETAEEAACREVFEETGYIITPDQIHLYKVKSIPTENNQNITLRFVGIIDSDYLCKEAPTGGEPDEVEEVKLIPIRDITKYQWAFGHLEIARTLIDLYDSKLK